jgi:hypothetical protein
MRRIKINIVMGLILAAIAAPAIVAQQAQSASARAAKPEGEYVSEKGFKNKIFEIKHRDPNSLLEVLRLLGSGFKGATMSVDPEYKTLTVRDFPENIAIVEEALNRLDVAQAQHPDMEFRIYVLLASSATGAATDYPSELNDVITQLRGTFKYKDYSLMTSSVHRTSDGPAGISNRGVAEAKKLTATVLPNTTPIIYSYELRPISLDLSAPGNATAHIGKFTFDMFIPISIGSEAKFENIGFKTPVSIREGEKIIVGTTTMQDRGLIVVLSARVIK